MRCDDGNNLLYPYMSCSFYIAVIGVEVGFHLPAKSLSTCYVFNMSHALISNAYIYIYIYNIYIYMMDFRRLGFTSSRGLK